MFLLELLKDFACKAIPCLISRFRKRSDRLQRQLESLYVPLRQILMSVHMERSSSMRFPYLHTRTNRMLRFFEQGKVKHGVVALFDRGKTYNLPYVTMGCLPYEELRHTIIVNVQYADAKLLDLLQEVECARADYTEADSDQELSYEEWQLCLHIMHRYRLLERMFAQ